MGSIAKKLDWKTLPIPDQNELIEFRMDLSQVEYNQIKLGLKPGNMDSKWFIYSESDHLFFHRSWTGHCIYILKLNQADKRCYLSDLQVNRDPVQYKHHDAETERKLVQFVIEKVLLKKNVPFPKFEYDE